MNKPRITQYAAAMHAGSDIGGEPSIRRSLSPINTTYTFTDRIAPS